MYFSKHFTKSGTSHYFSIRDVECIIRLSSWLFFKLSLVSLSHYMSNELLLCKYKHFKHQHKGETIMYQYNVEYMYKHGTHLSLIIVIILYMINFLMPLVYYVIIVYYHLALMIRLFMNSTCSHNRIWNGVWCSLLACRYYIGSVNIE